MIQQESILPDVGGELYTHGQAVSTVSEGKRDRRGTGDVLKCGEGAVLAKS